MVSHRPWFATLITLAAISISSLKAEELSQEIINDSSHDCTATQQQLLWPLPPLNDDLKLVSSYGIRSADNTMINLISHGASLPASGQALLTTVSSSNKIIIEIVTGNRIGALSNKLLGRVNFDIPGDYLRRGIPQILVVAELQNDQMQITVGDMFSGHEMVALFDDQGLCRIKDHSKDAQTEEVVQGGLGVVFTDQSMRDLLPRLWKFDNPYVSTPHPGYTFNGRFLKLKQRERPKDKRSMEHKVVVPQQHGDVVPSFTADKVWPAAYLMATFLEEIKWREPYVIQFERVLELGAGTGLVGMAAALIHQGSHITLTDLPENLMLLRENVELNSLQGTVDIKALDWTKPIPSDMLAAGPWDVVVAADCIFWEYLFEPFINTLAQLAFNATRVYVSMTHRFDRTKKFLALLKKKCIRIEKMTETTSNILNTDIYRIYGENPLGCVD